MHSRASFIWSQLLHSQESLWFMWLRLGLLWLTPSPPYLVITAFHYSEFQLILQFVKKNPLQQGSWSTRGVVVCSWWLILPFRNPFCTCVPVQTTVPRPPPLPIFSPSQLLLINFLQLLIVDNDTLNIKKGRVRVHVLLPAWSTMRMTYKKIEVTQGV